MKRTIFFAGAAGAMLLGTVAIAQTTGSTAADQNATGANQMGTTSDSTMTTQNDQTGMQSGAQSGAMSADDAAMDTAATADSQMAGERG